MILSFHLAGYPTQDAADAAALELPFQGQLSSLPTLPISILSSKDINHTRAHSSGNTNTRECSESLAVNPFLNYKEKYNYTLEISGGTTDLKRVSEQAPPTYYIRGNISDSTLINNIESHTKFNDKSNIYSTITGQSYLSEKGYNEIKPIEAAGWEGIKA